jgi:phage/plasmid-associated DNA primase
VDAGEPRYSSPRKSAQTYGGYKYCRHGSDFNSIARLAASIVAADDFFDAALIGIAAGNKFWRIENAQVVPQPLSAEHRQRMRLDVDRDFNGETPLWHRLLDHAFRDNHEQRELLETLFGAALSRELYRHRIAGLLLGHITTGKSTLLNVLAHIFPRDQVAAASPQRWANEYYLAGLAGKALNIVGELDAHEPIAGGAFNSVVGCDIIEGRHPTYRPFSFICTAAHFFNANALPGVHAVEHGERIQSLRSKRLL